MDPTEEEEFTAAFEEEEEEEEAEEEGKGEEKEEKETPEPEPTPDPNAADAANRSTLAGRIASARKGLPKMEKAYRESYGIIPGDPTEEDLAAQAEDAEARERVAEELPEVAQTIRHEVAVATEKVREDLEQGQLDGRNEAHFNTLAEAHPDIEAFQTPDSPENSLLFEWVDSHDYKEGKELARILENGSTTEVVNLLDDFKEAVEAVLKETPEASPAAAVVAAEAVPAGREATPVGAPVIAEDDFSGAFKAALADDG